MFGKEMDGKKVSPSVLQELAKSGEAQELLSLLQQNSNLQEAAKSAVGGDTTALMGMVSSLMQSKQGADAIGNLQKKAKDAGIED